MPQRAFVFNPQRPCHKTSLLQITPKMKTLCDPSGKTLPPSSDLSNCKDALPCCQFFLRELREPKLTKIVNCCRSH